MATHILVVDDDVLLVDVLAELLRAEGFEVAVAATYEEAVAHIEEADQLDLVLSDVDLRGSHSGIDVIEKVGQVRADVQGILISGHPVAYLEKIDPRVTNTRLLSKPFRVDQLLEWIENPPSGC